MPRNHPVIDSCCPFCNEKVAVENADVRLRVTCAGCGRYILTGSAAEVIPNWSESEQKWAAISYQVRRLTDRSTEPQINTYLVEELRRTAVLPEPARLLDEVVIWLARHSEYPGYEFNVSYSDYRAIFGAVNQSAFRVLVNWLRQSGWVDSIDADSADGAVMLNCSLTPEGWARYEELTKSGMFSRTAFMAMQFGDKELDRVVAEWFAPAVIAAGFELRRLDQGQPAGLIDDQLRVAIRTSRFTICDLTHGNKGVYWEGGFAEALGRPVIYTCRADVFHDGPNKPHFDTNHMVTVIWDPNDLPAAANKLKAAIRATLPHEAQLEDPSR